MGLKQILYGMMPDAVKTKYRDMKGGGLSSLPQQECASSNLRHKNDLSIENLFDDNEIEKSWAESKKELSIFTIPEDTGGVNSGDRKALYFLISQLKPSSVLEVGTHIGSSTLHIASALQKNNVKDGKSSELVSVDIMDVNSTVTKPWLKYNSKYSPVEMIDQLNFGDFVDFVADTSLNYAQYCNRKFDFIFLDGSHSASMVYQEVPMALKLLNRNGVILLHDYFPEGKPLWSNGSVIDGPYVAIKRLIKEGANLVVVPLGKLPWQTKLGSNITSLALLLNNE